MVSVYIAQRVSDDADVLYAHTNPYALARWLRTHLAAATLQVLVFQDGEEAARYSAITFLKGSQCFQN